ncbi:MAG: aminoacyl-tRNA hydrolase [Gemmatimonadetes bacterium]|nr:aminoacyl-tRNA hydrolase [Gemmatimonadota bacterium]
MKVIVGLGNPGREYAGTRHNVGWWVIDHLADVWRFDGWKKDHEALIATGTVGGVKVRLVKPQTFMNESGAAVRHYARRPFFAVASDLLVVVDEVALPVGRYRFRAKGSAGGHNGLKSIEHHLHTQDYGRLRIGVGPAESERAVGVLRDYVLGDFGKMEATELRALMPTFTAGVEMWLEKGMLEAMNAFPGKDRGE